MRIAIDISPLSSGHKVRGVGFYLENLKSSLIKYFPENKFIFFTEEKEIPKDVDLVHYPYFEPFFITLPFVKKHKTVVTVHDVTPLVFPKHFPSGIRGNLAWQIQKLNLKKSDAIITDSESSSRDVHKYTGISVTKIQTVYLAAGEEFKVIKSSSHQVIKRKYNLPEKFVLYVGDVTWNKNLPRLITAMKQVNIPLVMVGKSLVQKDFDKTNTWNKDLIEVQRLTDGDKRFIKLGFIPTEDLVAIYNLATVFVFPSLYEGFGLPVLEAMQSGTPVITTKEGSLPEVAGDAAYYIDAYSSDAIVEGLKKVLESEKLQRELSERGLQQAKLFSWEKTAKETLKVYKKVLSI